LRGLTDLSGDGDLWCADLQCRTHVCADGDLRGRFYLPRCVDLSRCHDLPGDNHVRARSHLCRDPDLWWVHDLYRHVRVSAVLLSISGELRC